MESPIGQRISELPPGERMGTITAVNDDRIRWTVEWDDGHTEDIYAACAIPSDAVHVLRPTAPSSPHDPEASST